MILVTGATGNIGSRVAALIDRPRVFVRDRERAKHFDDVVVGDLEDAAAVARAMEGVEAVFIASAGPGLAQRDEIVARAACDTKVKRIVKLSSMDVTRADGNSLAAWHARGEDAVRASGVPFVFVRPSGFMSNALAWAAAIRDSHEVRASTGDGRVPMIHPDDIAEVIAAALTSERFDGQALSITGPEALDYTTMVRMLSPDARFVPISDSEARERLLVTGKQPAVADGLVGLWRAVREGKLATVTNTVSAVLGKPPRTFAQWASENAAAFR